MPEIYRYSEISLVSNKSALEKFVYKFVELIGYSSTYLSNIGSSPSNTNIWKQQAQTIEENGEKIYRRKGFETSVKTSFKGHATITGLFLNHVKNYPKRKMLGWRPVIDVIKNPKDSSVKLLLGPFQWITSEEAYYMVGNLSTYMRSLNLRKNSKVLIFSNTCYEWILVALATMFVGCKIVTVYPSLRDEYIQSCIQLTEPEVVMVDSKTSPRFRPFVSEIVSLKAILFASHYSQDDMEAYSDINIPTVRIGTLFYKDINSYSEPNLSDTSDPNDLALIMFTSGTVSAPKGAMITQGNIIANMAGSMSHEKYFHSQTYPSCLQLAHILEFCCVFALIFHLGKIGFCSYYTLFDTSPMLAPGCISDLRALRPTCIVFVPLMLERIKKTIMEKLSHSSRLSQVIFESAYNVKSFFHSQGQETRFLDYLLFSKFCEPFGCKLKFGMIGGAFLSPQLEEFFNIILKPMKQAYGTTEVCCAGTMSEIDYVRPHNIGPPYSVSELKLTPWEEGGFDMTDSANPKGELLISGPCVCLGYYKNDKLTQEAFVRDPKTGKVWFRTADIAEFLDDGTFRIISRKNDMIKLSHGEYIELSRIESVISSSKFVDFVCVTANKQNNGLVAIIVPNINQIAFIVTSSLDNNNRSSLDIYLSNKEIVNKLESDIISCAKNAKLTKYEIPVTYIFVHDEWTPENDLLTPSLKIKRSKIVERYKNLLH